MDNLLTCQCACTKEASVVSFDCMLAMMQSTKLFAWWEPCMDVSHPPSLHPEWDIWRCAHYQNVKRLVFYVVIPQLHVFFYDRSALPLVFYPTPMSHGESASALPYTWLKSRMYSPHSPPVCSFICLPACLSCLHSYKPAITCVVLVHVFIGEQIFIILTY